jgi:hypothetical protein
VPGLIDEPFPGVAAVVENVAVRYKVKIRLESQFSRMNCQMFSTGLSSGDFVARPRRGSWPRSGRKLKAA